MAFQFKNTFTIIGAVLVIAIGIAANSAAMNLAEASSLAANTVHPAFSAHSTH